MSRVVAQQLVLVNWKGVFYQRYLLDRRVTALEGTNGAGKTTVMIAAYVVLFASKGMGGGGYDSLAAVQRLFAVPELLLAGWLHYLAFDLFVGVWIAKRAGAPSLHAMRLRGDSAESVSRWIMNES